MLFRGEEMPIYLYECEKCGHEIQIRAKMNDPKPIECQNCFEKNTLTKKIGGGQFKLSGGGWSKEQIQRQKDAVALEAGVNGAIQERLKQLSGLAYQG